MKAYSFFSTSIWVIITFVYSVVVLGCAQGGHAVATGDCAVAVGGSAINTVSPQVRASLGDSAIEAASRAMGTYLTKAPGLIGATETKQATATAVAAAERGKGSELTPVERDELENRAQATIREFKGRCGK